MKATSEAKARAVEAMFSSIARRYDLLNHLLSLGFDISWRKFAVAKFGRPEGKAYLDVACGTGDLSLALARAGDGTARVTGCDFSRKMVEIGASKVIREGLDGRVRLEFGDALNLSYQDNSFDGSMCAFGVRNFADLEKGLSEMIRVVKPGGRVVILEFTTPSNRLIAAAYKFYFTKALPFIGGLVSGNRSAYEYLPDSVYKFPTPPRLSATLKGLGMEGVEFFPLTFGICGVHTGVKS